MLMLPPLPLLLPPPPPPPPLPLLLLLLLLVQGAEVAQYAQNTSRLEFWEENGATLRVI
jgi:hypothetical protein